MPWRTKPRHDVLRVEAAEFTPDQNCHQPTAERAPEVNYDVELQQMREWVTAHKLEALRVCGEFWIDDPDLGDLRWL